MIKVNDISGARAVIETIQAGKEIDKILVKRHTERPSKGAFRSPQRHADSRSARTG